MFTVGELDMFKRMTMALESIAKNFDHFVKEMDKCPCCGCDPCECGPDCECKKCCDEPETTEKIVEGSGAIKSE